MTKRLAVVVIRSDGQHKHNITRLLGKGGMGEVYEAHDAVEGRTVALKILADQISNDAAFRTRFQRESRDSPRAAHHSDPRPERD